MTDKKISFQAYKSDIHTPDAGVLVVLNSGSAVPFVLNKCGIDPALATGPFITTLNDIMGLVIYLGLVTLFLGGTT